MPEQRDDHAERTWLSVDGLRLFARDYAGAAGPARLPVVCLHGLTRNSRDFEDLAPAIAALGRRVVVPDIRGRGRSQYDPNPRNYAPRVYASDIARLLDDLGLRRAVFIGTSMGGLITMALALSRPGAIAATILNDVGPEIDPAGIARIASYAGKPVQLETWEDAKAYVQRTAGFAYPRFADEDWDRLVARTFMPGSDRPRLDYDPNIAKPLATGRIKTSSWFAWRLFRRATRGRPSLLVRGALSDIVTEAIALKMRRANRRLRLAEIPEVGHAPTLDEPSSRQAVLEFLGDIP